MHAVALDTALLRWLWLFFLYSFHVITYNCSRIDVIAEVTTVQIRFAYVFLLICIVRRLCSMSCKTGQLYRYTNYFLLLYWFWVVSNFVSRNVISLIHLFNGNHCGRNLIVFVWCWRKTRAAFHDLKQRSLKRERVI